jgi:dipeptidyl aminopeptidase/acylaminoacyl peptidase
MNKSVKKKRVFRLGRYTAIAFLVYFYSSVLAGAPVVLERDGNIILTEASGKKKQLTSSGRDSNPVLNPYMDRVVFVRSVDGKVVDGTGREYSASELWMIQTDGEEARMLVRTRQSEQIQKLIVGFESIQFSSDGRMVYFVTPAWTTSGAIHVVDTKTLTVSFIVPGLSYQVVPSGKYRDHLLVQQRRYFMGGGPYVWFYLFTPDGKQQVGVVGEDTRDFMIVFGEDVDVLPNP